MLVGVPVDGVLHEFRPDAAVVEQGVALARRAVPDHSFTAPTAFEEELEQSGAHGARRVLQPAVPVDVVQAGTALGSENVEHPLAGRPRVRRRCRPESDGATVSGEFLDVDDGQVALGQRPRRGQDRPVLEVLVVDRVELCVGHQVECVMHLDADHAPVRDQGPETLGEAGDVRDVRVDVVRDDQIGRTVRGTHSCRGVGVEKRRLGGYAGITRRCTDIRTGLDAEASDAGVHDVLQKVSVVAGDLHDERALRQGEPIDSPRHEGPGVFDPAARERRVVRVFGERLGRCHQRRNLQQQAFPADPQMERIRGLGVVQLRGSEERLAGRSGPQVEDALEIGGSAEAAEHVQS